MSYNYVKKTKLRQEMLKNIKRRHDISFEYHTNNTKN